MKQNTHQNFTDLYEENYKKIKKNGKIILIIIVAIVPSLCYNSIKLQVFKIGVEKIVACQIPEITNSNWSEAEAETILEMDEFQNECYIKNYDYKKLSTVSFENAQKNLEESVEKIICPQFVAKNNNSLFTTQFSTEFTSYCEGLKNEVFYEVAYIVFYIFSCLCFVQFADLYGRRAVIKKAIWVMYLAVFIKIFVFFCPGDFIGIIILEASYPALKYPIEAIIFELTDGILRPFAFAATFLGVYVPSLIANFVEPTYTNYMALISYSPVLFLPLLKWFLLEPPIWFLAVNRNALANFLASHLNNYTAVNHVLFLFKNEKIAYKEKKEHYKNLRHINTKDFVLMNLISMSIGVASFYTYSKHRFLIRDFHEDGLLKFFYVSTGLYASFLVLPCLVFINFVRIFFISLFIVSGFLFAVLAQGSNLGVSENASTIILLIFGIDLISNCLQIIFGFYINTVLPTSHRCTCNGICGACLYFGIFLNITIREFHVLTSYGVTSAVCVVGAVSAFFLSSKEINNSIKLKFNEDEAINN